MKYFLVFFLLFPSLVLSAIIVDEDFDNGDFDPAAKYCCDSQYSPNPIGSGDCSTCVNVIEYVTDTKYAGTHSLHCDYNIGGAAGIMILPGPYNITNFGTDTYVRFYIKWDADFRFYHRTKIFRLHTDGNDPYLNVNGCGPNGAGTQADWSGTEYGDLAFYSYESFMYVSEAMAAQGEDPADWVVTAGDDWWMIETRTYNEGGTPKFDMWVQRPEDVAPVLVFDNITKPNMGIGPYDELHFNWINDIGSGSGGELWLDEIIISDSYIGAFGSNTYYVSTSGNDSYPGTVSQPWRTIQHAADTVVAGDTVYVRAGNYPETVEFTASGSASEGYITFQNYSDEEVTLSPGAVEGNNVSYFKLIGFHILNPPSDTPGIEFGGTGSYVEIRDNEITGCDNSDQAALRFGDHMTWFKIDGNHIHHNVTGTQEALRVMEYTSDFEITNNEVNHNTNIGIDVVGWAQYGKPVRGLISGNTSHNNSLTADWSAGIYLDCASEMIVEYNISYENYRGFEVACEPSGDAAADNIIRYNISYNNVQTGIHVGGYQGGTALRNEVYNNLFYENGSVEIGFDSTPGEDNHFYNNILYDPGTTLIGSAGNDNSFEYNSYTGNGGLGTNNITDDPLLTDDLRVMPNSPVLGAGLNEEQTYAIRSDSTWPDNVFTELASNGPHIGPWSEATAQYELTLNKIITNGDGTITSSPAGINCVTDICTTDSYDFAYTTSVTLLNDGDPVAWGGDCNINGQVTMTEDRTCTATFTAPQQWTLTVTKDITNGDGTISSDPVGIVCASGACTDGGDFDENSNVVLTSAGDDVVWSGDCSGTTDEITINMGTSDKNCTVTYDSGIPSSPAAFIIGSLPHTR